MNTPRNFTRAELEAVLKQSLPQVYDAVGEARAEGRTYATVKVPLSRPVRRAIFDLATNMCTRTVCRNLQVTNVHYDLQPDGVSLQLSWA